MGVGLSGEYRKAFFGHDASLSPYLVHEASGVSASDFLDLDRGSCWRFYLDSIRLRVNGIPPTLSLIDLIEA